MRPSSKELLRKAQVPAMLVTNPVHIRYLTDCACEGMLLVLPQAYVLFVSVLERETVEEEAFPSIKIADRTSLEDSMKNIRVCAIESDHMTISVQSLLKKKYKSIKFVQKSGVIEEFRRQKDTAEIRNIKAALTITDAILKRIPSLLVIGISERELSWKIERLAREMGADCMAFETIVAFGTHTSRPHHRPANRKLRKNDIVQIDMGVKVKGYCSDRSDVFFEGKPTRSQQKIYDVLTAAKNSVKKSAKAGVSSRSLDEAARTILRAHNLEENFIHALGHGVGLEIHEGITLSSKAEDMTLLKHEVIAIEPGVYFKGKFGMRLEDTVVISA